MISTKVEPAILSRSPMDCWPHGVSIAPNNFKHKSLSCWTINPYVGCSHACRFCYVPSVSTIKLGPQLAQFGITDPDEQWGEYALLRTWDEGKFLRSLLQAERTPIEKLNADGNRAIMLSSTTDPYQVVRHSDSSRGKELREQARWMIRRMLELIRDHSTLNVRILTRSPLAQQDFDLFQSFGNRLLFGMSIPTLNDRLARLYEPSAPAPSRRLETLRLAAFNGIPVYVAVAPTYPEQGESELAAVLGEMASLNPVTVFHEPINIRAENVGRMKAEAAANGLEFKADVFSSREEWMRYALFQLRTAQSVAFKLGLGAKFHPWPDLALGSRRLRYEHGPEYSAWIDECWNRISAWPRRQQERMAA